MINGLGVRCHIIYCTILLLDYIAYSVIYILIECISITLEQGSATFDVNATQL